MQPLVVGFVNTDTAQQALRQAADLARGLGAPLHVVTALDDPTVEEFDAHGESFHIDDYRAAEDIVHAFLQTIGDAPDYTVAVLAGKPADALLAEAERLDAAMIIVGNVRMQGPGRFLGSVGSKVVHHAPCNVLIVRTT